MMFADTFSWLETAVTPCDDIKPAWASVQAVRYLVILSRQVSYSSLHDPGISSTKNGMMLDGEFRWPSLKNYIEHIKETWVNKLNWVKDIRLTSWKAARCPAVLNPKLRLFTFHWKSRNKEWTGEKPKWTHKKGPCAPLFKLPRQCLITTSKCNWPFHPSL